MIRLPVLTTWIKQRTAEYRIAPIGFNLCWRNYYTVMSTNHVPAETVKRYYRVNRRDIAFLKFIFEAYDGLAIIETLNPESGVVAFYIAPGCETDVDMVLSVSPSHTLRSVLSEAAEHIPIGVPIVSALGLSIHGYD